MYVAESTLVMTPRKGSKAKKKTRNRANVERTSERVYFERPSPFRRRVWGWWWWWGNNKDTLRYAHTTHER
jgi:hypothetical protein